MGRRRIVVILLDTHALLWWQAGGQRLSRRAAREIARADPVLVSAVSCWELAMLLRKGRITLDRDVYDWIRDLYADEHVKLAPLTPAAAVGAALLSAGGFEGDPADQLLYATARELAVPLVTKDRTIREFARQQGDVRTVW